MSFELPGHSRTVALVHSGHEVGEDFPLPPEYLIYGEGSTDQERLQQGGTIVCYEE